MCASYTVLCITYDALRILSALCIEYVISDATIMHSQSSALACLQSAVCSPARQCSGAQMLHNLQVVVSSVINGSAIDGASPKGATVPSPQTWSGCWRMIQEDPRRGDNDTQWAHYMKHFPSVEGYTAVISRVIVKQTTSDCCNERLIHTYLDVLWCAIPTLVCLPVCLLPLMCCRPKMETVGRAVALKHTQVHTGCMYTTDYSVSSI